MGLPAVALDPLSSRHRLAETPAKMVPLEPRPSDATSASSALAWVFGVRLLIGPAHSSPSWLLELVSFASMERAWFSKNDAYWVVFAALASILRLRAKMPLKDCWSVSQLDGSHDSRSTPPLERARIAALAMPSALVSRLVSPVAR